MTSFWKIPQNLSATPLSLIKGQAAALTTETKGILRGEVETMQEDADLYVALSVVAPALDEYKVRILTYQQPVFLYPGKLRMLLEQKQVMINDESELLEALEHVLSSDRVSRIIGGLLSQSSSLAGEIEGTTPVIED